MYFVSEGESPGENSMSEAVQECVDFPKQEVCQAIGMLSSYCGCNRVPSNRYTPELGTCLLVQFASNVLTFAVCVMRTLTGTA